MELVLVTLTFGVLSTLTTTAITKKFFTPCFWYWLGWTIGVAGAELSQQTNTLPAVTPYGQTLIMRAHIGAFVGFLASSLWIRSIPRTQRIRSSISKDRLPTLDHGIWVMIWLQAFLGFLLLAQRVTGINILGIASIYDIRQSFLQDVYLQPNLPLLFRLYNYVTLIAAIAPILLAQTDARNRTISFRSLSLMFIASVPGGLSTGGRIWIASVFSFYLVSYFTAIDNGFDRQRIVRAVRFMLVPLVMLLALFTGIGFVRDVIVKEAAINESTGNNLALTALSPLYNYMGVTVAAIGPYSEYAARQPFGWGQLTFPWFASQLGRLGLTNNVEYLNFIAGSRIFVGQNFDVRLSTTHASIIPLLITDFGEGNLILAVAALTALLQILFLLFRKRWIWGCVLGTVICLYGGVFAFQDATIGTASAVIPVLSGWGYSIWRSTVGKRTVGISRHPVGISQFNK